MIEKRASAPVLAPVSARVAGRARTAVLLAPFALAGLAGAEGTDAAAELANQAKAGMTGIVTLLVAILAVGIGISVLWFANKNTKKGVAKSG